MAALICGSVAYDSIMGFEGSFADQIMPDQLHILNVSFFVPTLRREFGGCAGNIAYALQQLGGTPLPMATVGEDAQTYLAHFEQEGINCDYLRTMPGLFTAQAMIMTDRDNNQITAFHPGAMFEAQVQVVPAREDIAIGIISPDSPDAMRLHGEQMHAAGIPFVFDPGQNLPRFSREELLTLVAQADWVAVNDYEGQMLAERTGLSLADLSRQVKALFVTLGEHGCDIWVDGECAREPAPKVDAVVDPTGCGDAWRGALLYGLERGWPLARCVRLGNQMGAIKIASRGPQTYRVDRAQLGLTAA